MNSFVCKNIQKHTRIILDCDDIFLNSFIDYVMDLFIKSADNYKIFVLCGGSTFQIEKRQLFSKCKLILFLY